MLYCYGLYFASCLMVFIGDVNCVIVQYFAGLVLWKVKYCTPGADGCRFGVAI